MRDADAYARWCRSRGFRVGVQKSWSELEQEWCIYGRELVTACGRLRVDRDPIKLIAGVCSGTVAVRDIARPRWRALAENIEHAALTTAERHALRVLIEVAARRGDLILADGVFGGCRLSFLDGLIALSRRQDEWIRRPRAWRAQSYNARRQFTSLSRHLLARYPVPGFLDAAWMRSDEPSEQYRDWFIRIGSGQSLRGAPSPIVLTKRIVHHFLRAPASYGVEQAIRWGQIHALGGDRRLSDAVIETRLGQCFEHEDFWVSVIRFFVTFSWLDRVHVRPVVDYLQNQRFEPRDVFVARGAAARPAPPQHERPPARVLAPACRTMAPGTRDDFAPEGPDLGTQRDWRIRTGNRHPKQEPEGLANSGTPVVRRIAARRRGDAPLRCELRRAVRNRGKLDLGPGGLEFRRCRKAGDDRGRCATCCGAVPWPLQCVPEGARPRDDSALGVPGKPASRTGCAGRLAACGFG